MPDLFRRLGSRDAKPNPDAFWSDKWGWMDEASPADLIEALKAKGAEEVATESAARPGRFLVLDLDGTE